MAFREPASAPSSVQVTPPRATLSSYPKHVKQVAPSKSGVTGSPQTSFDSVLDQVIATGHYGLIKAAVLAEVESRYASRLDQAKNEYWRDDRGLMWTLKNSMSMEVVAKMDELGFGKEFRKELLSTNIVAAARNALSWDEHGEFNKLRSQYYQLFKSKGLSDEEIVSVERDVLPVTDYIKTKLSSVISGQTEYDKVFELVRDFSRDERPAKYVEAFGQERGSVLAARDLLDPDEFQMLDQSGALKFLGGEDVKAFDSLKRERWSNRAAAIAGVAPGGNGAEAVKNSDAWYRERRRALVNSIASRK